MNPQFNSFGKEENKNEGNSKDDIAVNQKDSQQGEAQHIDLVVRYKRTFVTESEDGELDHDEEKEFTDVDPARVEEFKTFIIYKINKNDTENNLEVQVKVDYLIKMFNVMMPDLQVLKLFYQNQNKGEVLTEANLKKLPQLVIKLIAKKIQLEEESSLITQTDVNPEEQRYLLIINLRLNVIAKIIDENQGLNEYDRVSVNSNISNEYKTPLFQLDSNDNQVFTNFNQEQTDTSIPLNQNLSEAGKDYHDCSENDVSFAENYQQISLEDRVLRIEKLWINFASTINQTFGNPGNQLESLDLQKMQSTPKAIFQKNNKSILKSPNNIDLHQDQENFSQFGSNQQCNLTSSPDTLIERADNNTPKVSSLQFNPSVQSQPFIKSKWGHKSDQNLQHSLALKPQTSASEIEGPNELFQNPDPSTLQHSKSMKYGQQDQESHNLEIITEQSEPQTDFIYLSSNPLVLKNDQGKKVDNQKLRIHKEIEEICQAIKSTKRQFNFKSLIGTSANLAEALIDGPKILHISSHGQQLKTNVESSTLLFEPTD